MRKEGLDENLAHHVSHLFTRDPLVIFDGLVELDDERTTDHFENIQSTNWQTCRWKPPPPRMSPEDPHIGWRTEFRSMEVQLTDFENAAFTVFVVLITRVVLAFDLALYIPLSKVDENMSRAHALNSVVNNKFFFRKFLAPVCVPDSQPSTSTSSTTSTSTPQSPNSSPSVNGSNSNIAAAISQNDLAGLKMESIEAFTSGPCGAPCGFNSSSASRDTNTDEAAAIPPGAQSAMNSCEEMTMDEIFNGKGKYYPGLIPLVYAYLDYIRCDSETFKRVDQYLQFISSRAKGELVTPATWMR